VAQKRITQFVELIETLGPDTKSDAPARFISIAAFIFTAFFAQWAGGGKKTAPYWMQQAWYVSVRNDAIAFDAQRWIRHQDRGTYNLDMYIGMDRIGENFFCYPFFGNNSPIHHCGTARSMTDDQQVICSEQIAQA